MVKNLEHNNAEKAELIDEFAEHINAPGELE
jgi:hypothetical protein